MHMLGEGGGDCSHLGMVHAHASISLGVLLFLSVTGLVDAAKLIEAKMTTFGVE